jgi:signal transduction histidine kinase
VTIRARLALLIATTIAVLVIAICFTTYAIVRSNLHSTARSDAATLARTAAAVEDPGELSLDRIAGPGVQVWLTNGSGEVVASNHAAGAGVANVADVNRSLAAAPSGSSSARAVRPGGGLAIVLLTNSAVDSTLSTLLSTLVGVGLVAVVASALAGGLLAKRALRPVERMRQEVEAIPGGAVERRIEEGRQDELGRLAGAFNRLLSRVEQATVQQRRFVADASHELRTPVTAVQGHARIVSRAAERGDLAQARESADIIAQSANRMSRTVSELLSLAETENAGLELELVRLDQVTADACAELQAIHGAERIKLELDDVTLAGDSRRLGELVQILVDNAVKYSSTGDAVVVSVLRTQEGAAIRVRDHGPGLTEADREHAFERFYRGTSAQGVDGSGLGLAIAKAIAEQHHGVLILEPAPGGGTIAIVQFAGLSSSP